MCELVYRMIKVECGVFVEMKVIQKAYDLAWFIIQLVYFYEKADFNLHFKGIAYVLERRSRKLCGYYVA